MLRFAVVSIAVLGTGCRIGFDSAALDASIDDGAVQSGRIEVVVNGAGAVVGPGIACTATCDVDATSPIDLTASPHEGWQFTGWTSGGSASSCTTATCGVAPGTQVTAMFTQKPITANVAFVSSAFAPRTGLAGLDALCVSLAASAGLPGTFVAFASTPSTNARDRLAGARGWVRTDGLPFVDQIADFGLDSLPRSLLLDENADVQTGMMATASSGDGIGNGNTCTNWTSASGALSVTGALVSRAGTYATGNTGSQCSNSFRVLCIQNDRNVAVELAPPPFPIGRYLFTSRQPFPMTGLAAADAQCQADATAGSLPGAYRAMLATTTESVRDRVGGFAGVWRRPDGLVIARNGLDQGAILSAPFLDALRAVATTNAVLYGADSPSQPGTTTCGDWTSTVGPANVVFPHSMTLFTEVGGGPCSLPYHLLCAQDP